MTIEQIMAEAEPLALFDFDYEAGRAVSGGTFSALLDRTGAHTISQGDGPSQFAATPVSPTGRRGAAISAAANQRMLGAPDVATALRNSQGYSTMIVARPNNTASSRCWLGLGQVSGQNTIAERYTAARFAEYRRSNTAGDATANTGTVAYDSGALNVMTRVYTGAATSSWMNSLLSVNAAANTRVTAGLDTLVVGSAFQNNVFSLPADGDLYALLISLAQWTEAKALRISALCKAYWGTV